jgi:hypothetical protein
VVLFVAAGCVVFVGVTLVVLLVVTAGFTAVVFVVFLGFACALATPEIRNNATNGTINFFMFDFFKFE